MNNDLNENTARRYLLGELSEAEAEIWETKIFADIEARSFVETVEIDLIDEYVRGELTGGELKNFQKMFLESAVRRERIAIACAYSESLKMQNVSVVIASKTQGFFANLFASFSRPVFVAVAAVFIFAGLLVALFLVLKNNDEIVQSGNFNQPQNQLSNTAILSPNPNGSENSNQTVNVSPAPTKNEQADSANTAPNAVRQPEKRKPNPAPIPGAPPSLPKPTAPNIKPAEATLTLATLVFPLGSLRDNNSATPLLEIKTQTKLARLTFPIMSGDNFPLYRIDIKSHAGEILVSAKMEKQNGAVSVSIPAARLKSEKYTATVSGIGSDESLTDIGFYDFRVETP